MKLHSPLLFKFAGLLGSAAVRNWMSTLDYKVAYYDRAIDPVFPECSGQKIYIFWHEYILFPLFLRGHCNMAMLLSRHPDAEILSYAAHYLGFDFVRGSTNRGGVAAIRELLEKSRRMNLTITPDGPRRTPAENGPRLHLPGLQTRPAPGSDGLRIRPALARYSAWDKFAIPRPFSRACAVPAPKSSSPPTWTAMA